MFGNLGFLPGLNFSNMNLSSETIDKKLSDPNSTLDDLLTEDELLQEFRTQNKKLLNYFNKEKVKQLLDYIIKEPTEDSQNKGYKFPFICSQLFGLEEETLMNYFFKTNKELLDYEKNRDSQKNLNEADIKNLKQNNNSENDDDQVNLNDNEEIKENDNKIELLDYFFTFLDENKELNYVLCGYFSSLMNNLLNMNGGLIIKYIYTMKTDILSKMVNHCYRKSISETLSKILQFENYIKNNKNNNQKDNNKNLIEIDNNQEKKFSNIRKEILINIFEKIDINLPNEKLYSMQFLIDELIETKIIFKEIFDDQNVISYLVVKPLTNINLIKNNENIENLRRNFIVIIDIIINFLKNIKKDELQSPMTFNEIDEDEDTTQIEKKSTQVYHTKLSNEIFRILEKLIEINFNYDNTEENNQKYILSFDDYNLNPLGIYRIKIVELIDNLLTYCIHISEELDKILINCKFFENAFKFLFKYEWNNIYQETFLNLLKKLLDDSASHELLTKHIFLEIKILDIITSHLENLSTDKFKYKSTNSTSHGYIAFLISLSYKINAIIGGTPLKINGNLNQEGSISFMNKSNNGGELQNSKEEIDMLFSMIMKGNTNSSSDNINYNDNEEKMVKNDFVTESKSDIKIKQKEIKNVCIECMKKYLNDKWEEFFKTKIADVIKLYESKLCEIKKENNDDVFGEKNKNNNDTNNMEVEQKNNNEEKNENIFENSDNKKNEENNNDDIFGSKKDDDWLIGTNNNTESAFKDKEIDINDFDFGDGDEEKKDKEEKNEK